MTQAQPPGTHERPLGVVATFGAALVVFVLSQVAGTVAMGAVLAGKVVAGKIAVDTLQDPEALRAALYDPWSLAASVAASSVTLVFGTFVAVKIAKLRFLPAVAIHLPRASHVALAILLVMSAGPVADAAIRAVQWAFPNATFHVLETLGDAAQARGLGAILMIAAIAVGPGVGEETLFRGLVQRSLVPRVGVAGGIGLSSFLFGLAHVDPPQAVGAALLGAALGLVSYRTKSIVPAMAAHTTNNGLALLSARLSAGAEEPAQQTSALVPLVSAVVFAGLVAVLLRATRDLHPR